MTKKTIPIPAKTTPKKVAATRNKAATIKPLAAQPAVAKIAADKPGKKAKKSAAKPEIKVKTVRGSFTMPKVEYEKISDLKQTCLKAGLHVKKNELLRAGLRALSTLSVTQLKQAIGKLDT